jgi:prepilin-type N-terminal cleavage/methylation domain-containing protein
MGSMKKAFTLIELLVVIAVIADPAAEQTMVTVFAESTYVLQLEADDGEYTGSDTMTIKE